MKTKYLTTKKIKLHIIKSKLQKGFTLIEMLVAVVLLGLAFISMLLLQTNTMRYSTTAYYRGIASQVANGLASSIRVNKNGLSSYEFTDDYSPDSAIPAATCVGTATCSAEKIAKADIAWARQSARNQLPGGDLHLTRVIGVKADEDYVDMTLIWIPAKGKDNEVTSFQCDAGVAGTYDTAQCLSIRVKI